MPTTTTTTPRNNYLKHRRQFTVLSIGTLRTRLIRADDAGPELRLRVRLRHVGNICAYRAVRCHSIVVRAALLVQLTAEVPLRPLRRRVRDELAALVLAPPHAVGV